MTSRKRPARLPRNAVLEVTRLDDRVAPAVGLSVVAPVLGAVTIQLQTPALQSTIGATNNQGTSPAVAVVTPAAATATSPAPEVLVTRNMIIVIKPAAASSAAAMGPAANGGAAASPSAIAAVIDALLDRFTPATALPVILPPAVQTALDTTLNQPAPTQPPLNPANLRTDDPSARFVALPDARQTLPPPSVPDFIPGNPPSTIDAEEGDDTDPSVMPPDTDALPPAQPPAPEKTGAPTPPPKTNGAPPREEPPAPIFAIDPVQAANADQKVRESVSLPWGANMSLGTVAVVGAALVGELGRRKQLPRRLRRSARLLGKYLPRAWKK
jgi:hypothetical protein